MSREPKCLITGCELWNSSTKVLRHGDLHMFAGAYIFYSTPQVLEYEKLPAHLKTIVISDETPRWQRGNVWIFEADPGLLTPAALEYLQKWEPERFPS